MTGAGSRPDTLFGKAMFEVYSGGEGPYDALRQLAHGGPEGRMLRREFKVQVRR